MGGRLKESQWFKAGLKYNGYAKTKKCQKLFWRPISDNGQTRANGDGNPQSNGLSMNIILSLKLHFLWYSHLKIRVRSYIKMVMKYFSS